MTERTLAIIKPNATERALTGAIVSRIEEERFRIVGLKQVVLTRREAEGFYAEHRDKGFFSSLVTFMTSGPVVLLALERDGAILHWRHVMGNTNPEKADEGTLRKVYGESIERNATHGSDGEASARREISYFFNCFETL